MAGDLAPAILAENDPQVAAMRGWLQSCQPLMAGMPGMTFDQMSTEQLAEFTPQALPRMATGSEIAKLSAARGARFDRLFLGLVLELRRGALAIAATERAAGSDPSATALASTIESAQKVEVDRIQKLLDG